MIRENEFLISRNPYAIDLSTVSGARKTRDDTHFFAGSCQAVWFRRQNGVNRACFGTLDLWAHYLSEPVDMSSPQSVLSAPLDGRYGATCLARWDGTSYWGSQQPEIMQKHLELLRTVLDNFPDVPAGYDGWWTFRNQR